MSVERRATRRSTAENRIVLEPDLVEKKQQQDEVKSAGLEMDIIELKKQQGLKVKEVVENEENIVLGAADTTNDVVPDLGTICVSGVIATKDVEEEEGQVGSTEVIEEDGNGVEDPFLLKDEAVLDESDSGEPEAKILKLDVDEEATNDSAVSGESAGSISKPKRKEKVTYPCPECDWKFQKKLLLTKHMKQHSADKPFACEQCDKGFFQEKGLIKHIRTIHNGEEASLHACPFCQKGFITRSEMDSHKETHVHEYKIYACRFCGKTFNKKFAMKVSIQASQDQTPDPCPYCNKAINAKAYSDK